jgi:succinate dehydrogenase/fumarate reductase cytochrome b subunit
MSIITDLRKYRAFDMAIFDWVATLIGAILLSRVIGINFGALFLIMIILAIIVHAALGIPTMFNAYIGLAKKEDVYAARAAAETQLS